MAQEQQSVIVRGLHRGMADATVVADSKMPAEQMREIINMDTDAIGFLTRRKGYTRLGSAAVSGANTILGGIHHKGTNSQIIAFANSDANATAFYLVGGTWTEKALGFTSSKKVRAISFLNYIIAVNGTDSPKSWTGSASDAWGTTQLTSAPIGSLVEVYKQQVYIGNTTTDTITFSTIPTSSVIAWPVANNFILNPNDGQNLTAMKRYGQELLLLKNDFMYRFNASSVDADPIIFYGTPSQEAVTVTAGVFWFYDAGKQGAYGYAGGYPTWISKPVSSFFKAVPTFAAKSVACWSDNDHVEWFLGDLIVGGVLLPKMAARYTISTRTWTLRNYANTFSVFIPFDDGTNLFNLGGTSASDIVKMDIGNIDLSAPISFRVETPWYTLGNNPALEFTMSSFSVFAENTSGNMDVQYKTDRDVTWISIGSSRQFTTTWNGINAHFNRIKFRFTGISSSDQIMLDGFAILSPLLEGIEKDSMIFNP